MTRVLIADDSATARAMLRDLLEADGDLEVVGVAHDGAEAIRLVAELHPDIVTMDIHMPGLDGFAATQRLMADSPLPIVIVTGDATALTMDALGAGALALVRRPAAGDLDAAVSLRRTVRALADVKVVRQRAPRIIARTSAARERPRASGTCEIVAIAASAGGPAALAEILASLRGIRVPILIVQHNVRGFMPQLTTWLATRSVMPIALANAGPAQAGRIYVAPDEFHLGISGQGWLTLTEEPPVDGFRPSATWMFESVARAYGERALGVILTGMGRDGVRGLQALHARGGRVIAQDEETSAVFGMPAAAAAAGVVDEVLPLQAIAGRITELASAAVIST